MISMKSLWRAGKTAALFVGSVVGAGFATGQELQLFFRGEGVWSLALAAVFMAVAAFAFMDMGARRVIRDPRVLWTADSLVALCSFAVYAAMIAAAEGVLKQLTGQSGGSILLAIFVMFLTAKRASGLSALNLVAVPLMAAIVVSVGIGGERITGGFRLLRPLAYAGMNLLFSGALMIREGESMALRERVIASVTSGGVIFLMMLFLWRSVGKMPDLEMPFLVAASREGLGTFASVSLLLAILTTMASCAYLVTDRLTALIGDPTLCVPLVPLAGILTSTVGFASLVRTVYPIVSYLGIAATLIALFLFLGTLLRKFFKGKRQSLSS